MISQCLFLGHPEQFFCRLIPIAYNPVPINGKKTVTNAFQDRISLIVGFSDRLFGLLAFGYVGMDTVNGFKLALFIEDRTAAQIITDEFAALSLNFYISLPVFSRQQGVENLTYKFPVGIDSLRAVVNDRIEKAGFR